MVKTKKWWGIPPEKCELCGIPFGDLTGQDLSEQNYFIDGSTVMGPWAIMCEDCHETRGNGLGTGKGQKYRVDTLEKVGG